MAVRHASYRARALAAVAQVHLQSTRHLRHRVFISFAAAKRRCARLLQLAREFTRFLHLFRICPVRERAAYLLDLGVRFWVHLCVPPLPLSPSESVSATLSWSVSFSPVAGMFEGWFTWLLSPRICPWCDLGLVGVAVLLTKIYIRTSWDLLTGLDQVSKTSRQLLEKSSYDNGWETEPHLRLIRLTANSREEKSIILLKHIICALFTVYLSVSWLTPSRRNCVAVSQRSRCTFATHRSNRGGLHQWNSLGQNDWPHLRINTKHNVKWKTWNEGEFP